ncbi:heme-degrading domain-containing protein [Exiguobacterium sp. RIT594]|uniref:heme-degrading domain-containing protein n=1 Tax=Exiguobacterium sp. RIT594 TaxID=2282449 RepID=UPI000DF76AB2|nr:heme-degrading domain-containing protein [Exiguobacterium sp. RIT594]RDB32232.1 heme-degrading domain-containing protein [Exiguobacterium sp. RIT594]
MRLTELLTQEQTLTLRSFTNQDALRAGQYVIDRAMQEQLSVAVELKRNGQRLFYAALDGTAPDQEEWIRRKSNVVLRHGHSSLYMRLYNESKNRSYHTMYAVDPADYADAGGSFPVRVTGVGVIGTITVSGLSQEADHQLAVEALTYLNEQQK